MNNNENIEKINNHKIVTDEVKSDIVIPPFLIQEEGMRVTRIVMGVIALAITAVMVAIVYRKNSKNTF